MKKRQKMDKILQRITTKNEQTDEFGYENNEIGNSCDLTIYPNN